MSSVPEPTAVFDGAELDKIDITANMVEDKLRNTKTTSSPGPDGVHPRILFECSKSLSRPLALIYRQSLESGCLPRDWKLGSVVPIYKKGQKQQPGNYRPVSLTSIPCKILESLIRDSLMEH